jgi:hypothetical protein
MLWNMSRNGGVIHEEKLEPQAKVGYPFRAWDDVDEWEAERSCMGKSDAAVTTTCSAAADANQPAVEKVKGEVEEIRERLLQAGVTTGSALEDSRQPMPGWLREQYVLRSAISASDAPTTRGSSTSGQQDDTSLPAHYREARSRFEDARRRSWWHGRV